jgi:hypothetical protein
MTSDPQPKWIMPTPGQWVQVPYIRDGKGDRPADNINQSKEQQK